MQKERELEIYRTVLNREEHSSVMLACINGHRGTQPYGKVICNHLPKLTEFLGIHQLVLAIDELCEQAGTPMKVTEPRFLSCLRGEQYRKLSDKCVPIVERDKKEATERAISFLRSAGTIVAVEVMYRQHSSMQGRLHSKYAGTKYIAFRSALELMRMLDEINEKILQENEKKSKSGE